MNDNRLILKLKTYMQICRDLASLSHDSKYSVASIAVTDDFREISAIGYNGDYSGGPNVRLNFEHGESGFLHAEDSMLVNLSKPIELRHKMIIFCTHKPCSMCAKRITGSGIKRVIFENEYSDVMNMTDEIFEKSGVICYNLHKILSSKEIRYAYLGHEQKISEVV